MSLVNNFFKIPVLCLVVSSILLVQGQSMNIIIGESCSGFRPGTKFTNPDNCRAYIICQSDVFQLWYCPSGFYNPLKDDCDLDYKCILDNVPGVSNAITETTTPMDVTDDFSSSTSTFVFTTTDAPESSTESTTISIETTSILSSSTTDISPDLNSCPAIDTELPTYLSDAENCERYFLCYNSKPIELMCLSGLYFNSITKMCDLPENVECPADGKTEIGELPKCQATGRYTMAHPENCAYFLMCIEGEQTVQQCHSFQAWDVLSQQCVLKERAVCAYSTRI